MSPSAVALLLGVPVSEPGFRRAWANGSSYLRSAYSDSTTGWAAYAPAAQLAATLCRECQLLGATVVCDATLADLAAQAARFRVVVLIAHMEFPKVVSEDLRDSQRLLQRVHHGQELEWEMLRSTLQQPVEALDVIDVIDALNLLLAETHRQLGAEPIEDLRDAEAAARQRRAGFGLLRFDRPRLDELCGEDVLAPAAGIELAGRMITARELSSAFPADYDGFVDLRMCNSISAGAALRRARPRMRVAVSKRQARMEAALILLKTALLCMTRRKAGQANGAAPLTYEDAMRIVVEAVR